MKCSYEVIALFPDVQVDDSAWVVRSSALAALSAAVAALGAAALPVLPRLVPAVFGAAETASADHTVSMTAENDSSADMETDDQDEGMPRSALGLFFPIQANCFCRNNFACAHT